MQNKTFLGTPFTKGICPRCKQEYSKLPIDTKGKICPKCDNDEQPKD